MSAIHKFSIHKSGLINQKYLIGLTLDMDLFRIGGCGTADTGIVNALQHEHLVVGLIAKIADLTDFHGLENENRFVNETFIN